MNSTGKRHGPPALQTGTADKPWPAAHQKLITFLGALCMLLSAVEYAIPKPVPFMRLGLANLPVLLALYIGLSASEYFLLVALKILTQALVSGTLFSYVFLFSLCGSLSSAATMWLLFRAGRCGRGAAFVSAAVQEGICQSENSGRGAFSAVGISLGGALANNLAQLALSYFLLFGDSTRYIAPVLLITGVVTGVLLALFAEAFMSRSRWFAAVCAPVALHADSVLPAEVASEIRLTSESEDADKAASAYKTARASESGSAHEGISQSEGKRSAGASGTVRFCAALLIMLVFLFISEVRIKAALTVIFYIAARSRRHKVRILPSAVILVTVTLAALLSPAGRVLVRVGNFPITLGALETGLSRALTLVGMVFLSQYATSGTIKLPGAAGALLESVINWFSVLTSEKMKFQKGKIIATLDEHLLKTYFLF